MGNYLDVFIKLSKRSDDVAVEFLLGKMSGLRDFETSAQNIILYLSRTQTPLLAFKTLLIA